MKPVSHVMHVIDGLGLGGAERMLIDLANATVARGATVTVCVTRSECTQAGALAPSVGVVTLDRRGRWDVRGMRRFGRLVRARRPDVLHVHLRSTFSFVAACRLMGLARGPTLLHDHYGTIESDRSVPWWFRVLAPLADAYVGVHEDLADWARRAGVPGGRIRTIPNALDLRRLEGERDGSLRRLVGAQPSELVAVCVGTVRQDKGLDVLIDALARMEGGHDLKVAVVGAPGPKSFVDRCRRLAAERGVEGRLVFLGPRSDAASLVRDADLGVMASRTESGPLALIEYCACGLPVVYTAVGNIGRQAAAAGVDGAVPPGDSVALARALDELESATPETRAARGAVGRAVARSLWSVEGAIGRWFEAYDELAGGGR